MKFTKLLLSVVLSSCAFFAQASVTKDGNRVMLKLDNPSKNGPALVCLEVISDNIIRVQATPENQLPQKQESLMIVPQTSKAKFTTTEDDNSYLVKAQNVTARVDKKNGRVTFFDAQGKQLAQEAEDGKTFMPFRVPEREIGIGTIPEEQRNGLSWTLKFNPQQEALYGLGQHQAGELNMKGKNEDLFQYNTKVSIPFVLSTNGYGILWDSYSYCRFGKDRKSVV